MKNRSFTQLILSLLAVFVAVFAVPTIGWATTDTFTTAGSTTWTCPAGVFSAQVECWGGGGSGGAGINGGGTTNGSGAGGGGGGAYALKAVAVTPGTVYNLVVGAGGAAGTTSNPGADSTFNATTVVARGGAAGASVNGQLLAGSGGAGGSAAGSVGDTTFSGGTGANGVAGANPNGGGGGGSSAGTASSGNNGSTTTAGAAVTGGGAGGNGATSSANGSNASSPGGGGGGAKTASSTQRNGGAGGTGKVAITYTAATAPVVAATTAATSIADSSASTGGNVTSDGGSAITERGVVYKTSTGPTTADNKVVASGTTGSFTSSLTGLSPGTTYFVRAYAINGVGTTYGSEISFTTAVNAVITGGGTATAFTSTYGTASAVQTFAVGGTGLVANILASAPAGFEVSSNGTTFASTASFTQSGGTASGTLSVRLAATASVGGVYDGQNITLASTGATTVNVTTAASGNAVSPASLTITANNATKAFGNTLGGAGPGSTAFTSSGLVNSETVGTVTIIYTNVAPSDLSGAGATDPAGTYTGSIVPSAATGGTFTASNYAITYAAGNITVTADPIINVAGTLAALNTTYGTASTSTSVVVSASNLNSPSATVTVTAPANFEVSLSSGTGFAAALDLTASSGAVADTAVYTRLKATAPAGTYSGSAVGIAGGGAAPVNVSIPSSTVNTKALTITGVSGVSREYNGNDSVSLSGTPSYVGLENGESFTVTGTPSAFFTGNSKTVGPAKPITVLGYTAPSADYTVSQPTGLTADITAKALTVTVDPITKVYNGSASVNLTGSLVGIISPDMVTTSGTGTFASANVGTGIAVNSPNFTLGGADAANYTVTQPTGLTGDITKANQTITFGALPAKTTADAPFALTATASSGLTVSYVSSNPAVATVSGDTVTIVGAGTTDITASQAGDSNYNAAAAVIQTLTLTAGPTTLAAGDIAIIGYNASGSPDSIALLVLKTLNAGTTFYVSDNEVSTAGGTTFGDVGEAEATFTVSSGQTVPAGTVVILPWGNQTVTDSRFTWTGHTSGGLGAAASNTLLDDGLYIYTGTSATALTPTAFIYYARGASATSTVAGEIPAGLSYGTTAIQPNANAARYKTSGATYSGSQAQLLAAIGNTASNWEATAPVNATDWTFSVKAAQTITFGALTAVTFGDVPFNLGATSSSGLTVSYASSNPAVATVSGNTVTIIGAGTTSITASQVGDATYASATDVPQTLTVNKANQTITFNALANVTYGDAAFDPGATATSGGTVAYSSSNPAVATVSGSLVTIVGAGTTSITASQAGTANYNAAPDVSQSLTVGPKAVSITAGNMTKAFGSQLNGPVANSTNFTASGFVSPDSVATVTLTYGPASASGAAVGTYVGQVTASDAAGSFTAGNYTISYLAGDIIVSNAPTLALTGNPGAQSTTYGTASAGTSFVVSGQLLTGDVTVTAPAGFELQGGAAIGWFPSIVLNNSTLNESVSIRLADTAAAGSHGGNITATGGGTSGTQTLAMPSSTVDPKDITITGVTGVDKVYDRNTTATLAGTPALAGVVGSDDVFVSGTPTAAFIADFLVGNNKGLTVTGYTLGGTAAANYNLLQPTGITANITPKALTIPDAAVTSKVFDGNTNATITGTLTGVIAPDSVSFAGTGTFASTGPGTDIVVTSSSTLTGADAGNYSLTQPTGLTGTITGSTNANLTNLTTNAGLLGSGLSSASSIGFQASVTTYSLYLANGTTSITVTPTLADPNATVTVNGNPPSTAVSLNEGLTVITILVTAQDTATTKIYTINAFRSAPALTTGAIAITGFDADGGDDIAFVALQAIPENSVIFFSDNEWNGSAIGSGGAFNDFTEGEMVWIAPAGGVAAGSVVVINNVSATIATNVGTVGYADTANKGYSTTAEAVYAFQGATHTPSVFLAGVTTDSAASFANTGLASGSTLVTLSNSSDGGRYKGARTGQSTFAGYLSLIGNVATNWDDIGGGDGTSYLPYSTSAFTLAAATPTVTIAATDASAAEAGTDPGTFRITRSGDTTNALTVSYAIATGAGQAVSADYAEALSGTAIIPAMQSFVDLTITPVDDVLLEGDETVTLTIQDAVDYDLGGNVTASVTITDNETSIDLSRYVRVARYGLPHPTNTTPPDAFSLLCQEASSVTWNWDTDTLFIVGDGGTSIVQVSKTGAYINSMTLAAGSSPQGTEFYDTEGLTYVGGGKFVLVEERYRQVNLFTYVPNATLQRANVQTVKLGTTIGNVGVEGICFDPQTSGFIGVKEKDPESIFQTSVDFNAGTATNGSPTTVNATDLFTPALANTSDFSDIFVLANLPTLNGKPASGDALLISQESGLVRHLDRNGNILSTLTITADVGDTVTIPDMTMEGVTMDRDGVLYIVNENGGGDSSHPQLWVYAPSTAVNLAPTAIALNNAVTSLPEDSNTSAAVKLADILVTDDGLGPNDLSITGADASFFQITGTALQLKPGTSLSATTKPSYSITVNVDDTSVGSTPDASTNYTLTITAAAGGAANLIISEVAPWSSTNGVGLGADWFEVTNIGNAAADITGWKVDDSGPTFATAVAMSGITSIAPGESVIFIETSGVQTASGNAANFRALWFGANPPANLQIGSYSGSGIGLSTGGDAVNLFDAGGTIRAGVTFGSSPSGPFPTFDNAAGLNGTAISTLSVVGTNGAFTAVADGNEIGSPGTITGSSTPIITIVATDASAAEQGTDPGTFRISRTGTTVGNLTVNYTVATGAGQAVAADHTETLSGSAIIPSGSAFVDLTITPVDDVAVEGGETVTLTLFDTGSYDVGSPDTATVTIADNDIANQPPTAVVLSNTVTTLREDASTASAVRVADIAITDDGQGTNTLSLSGADAAFFEIAGASLYLKAGTALSYNTKPGYSVTVNVDDASVGTNPDASTNFTLAITQFVAPGTIIVSEVAPWSSGNSGALNADWFEVTNIGSSVVNIAGWKIDDNSNAFVNAVALTGVTSIAAGESVIFIESSNLTTSAAAFRTLWFGANPPAGLQIGAYTGSGVGLGTGGDAVNLFDAAGNRVTGINVGASPAGPFATFDNAEGAGSTTLPLPTVSTLSTVGVHGAFVAANDANETGSPGTIVTVPTGSVYQIELASYTVAEDAGPLLVKITRTGATPAADVTFTTMDGTAHAGTDFTAPANPVHFDSGATFVNVSIPITDLNSTPQGNRSFTAAITAVPAGSTIGGSSATMTITEAEGDGGVISFAAAPTLSVSPKTSNGSGAPNTVTVVINRGTSAGGTVSFELAAGVPATVPTGYAKLANGTDYTYAGETVTFTNGQTTKTVNIPLTAAARKGQFKLTATNITGGTFPAATLTIQVEAKDSVAPTLTAALSGSSPTVTGNTTAASLTLTATAADPASTASSPSSGLHRVDVNVKSVSTPLAGTTTTYLAPTDTATLAGGVPVTLEAGLNTFTITAYDNAGNSKVVTIKRTFVNTDLTGLAGTYLGLLLPQNLPANIGTGAVSNDTVGFVSVTVSATAAVSGKLMMSGLTLPFTGVLANGGTFRAKTTNTDYIDLFDRVEFESYLGALSFGVAGNTATGALKTGAAGSALAAFTAEKQFASPQIIPTSVIPSGASAKYTLAIPAPTTGANAGAATFPQGDGWATITVTGAGVVSVRGKLADGTNLSMSNKLHGTGVNSVPLYAPLYRRNGAFAMELTFANATDSDVSGTDAVWIRPNQPRARYYKAGWANGALLQPVGTLFTTPATTSILLGITTGTAPAANIEVQFGDGYLDSTAVGGSATRLGRIGNIAGATLNKFTKPPTEADATFTLALSVGAGTFTGKFKHTDGTVLSYQGVVLQKGANRKGFGYFLSTPPFTYGGGGQSGGVTVLPLP